jgi:hypothetical protein
MIESTDNIGALDTVNAGDRCAFIRTATVQTLEYPNSRIVNPSEMAPLWGLIAWGRHHRRKARTKSADNGARL